MENQNDYVLNHNYCYERGLSKLNKLKLRNFNDLETYVQEVIEDLYFANIQDMVIDFIIDISKTEIIFEVIK